MQNAKNNNCRAIDIIENNSTYSYMKRAWTIVQTYELIFKLFNFESTKIEEFINDIYAENKELNVNNLKIMKFPFMNNLNNNNNNNNNKSEDINIDKIYHGLFKLVQYGWKREAVPVIHEKKSLIARFFDLLFN